MSFLIIISLFIYQQALTSAESIDGRQLSERLKEIRDGVGVTHMQAHFNKLPYRQKTGDGNELLHNIKTNIEGSLSKSTNILRTIQSQVLQQDEKFTPRPDLPLCCNIKLANLNYDQKFRHEVNFSTACVTKSPIAEDTAKYPPKELGDLMKQNYNNDKNILWQHYGTRDGTSVIYPALKWEDCNNYDPRLRPAYTVTASPRDKDVVLVLDSSSSMKQPSGVKGKKIIGLAKEAINTVIQTLSPHDRVAALSFNADIVKGVGCYSHSLSYATKENNAQLKQFVSLIPESSNSEKNSEKAVQTAFSFLQTNDTNRDKVVMFVSDGGTITGKDPREVIRDENGKIQNSAMIFTYILHSGGNMDSSTIFQEMASQVLSNATYGTIRQGHYSIFEPENHYKLAIDMASFYEHIQDDSSLTLMTPKYSVPYVDPFSEVGLMTSLCLPVRTSSMFHGVVCTDVKISELLKDVEFFEEGKSSYAFMIDKSGGAIAHPLLPDPTYVSMKEDTTQVDISALERSPGSTEILEKMKSGIAGNKTLSAVYFTIPRGTLVEYGSSVQVLKATYFWAPIDDTDFTVAIVLGDESHSEISEVGYTMSDEDLKNSFMYHERSLKSDNHQNCRFNSRLVTLDTASVKFAASAFKNPFQYIDKAETSVEATGYEKYFTKVTNDNPGFKDRKKLYFTFYYGDISDRPVKIQRSDSDNTVSPIKPEDSVGFTRTESRMELFQIIHAPSVRADVWATYEVEKFWKTTTANSNHLWRYIGTMSGSIRVYPGVSLKKTYDHRKRPWFRQTVSHPELMYITPPYEDAWGSGILITQAETLYKRNSTQVTAVLATDFPLKYFNWFIEEIYPSCATTDYRCIIIEDNGFIVMHPSFKDSTNAEKFQKSIHITEEEPAIAKEMVNNGLLTRQECQDLSVNKELRSFRVTMPPFHTNGLNFADTNDQFELKPIPETNIFIIRQRTSSTLSDDCKCDDLVQPDFRRCGNCECLCYTDVMYNTCLNNYSMEDRSPCSARLPDTSGVSTPEDLTNLPTCFNPTCSTKSTKSACFSQAECGWCEFTVDGFELDQQCCRLKEDCSFGKTNSKNRDSCGGNIVSTTYLPNEKEEINADKNNSGIVGGLAAAGGIVLTLIVCVTIYIVRKKDLCSEDDGDPYIDAVHAHDHERPASGDFVEAFDNDSFERDLKWGSHACPNNYS